MKNAIHTWIMNIERNKKFWATKVVTSEQICFHSLRSAGLLKKRLLIPKVLHIALNYILSKLFVFSICNSHEHSVPYIMFR